MSRFNGPASGRFRSRFGSQAASDSGVQSRTLTDLAVTSATVGFLDVNQPDSTRSAMRLMSNAISFSSNMMEFYSPTNVLTSQFGSAGRFQTQSYVTFVNIASPGAAPAGGLRVYSKAVGAVEHLMFTDEAGREYDLGQGGSSVFALTDAATIAVDCSKGSILTISTNAARNVGAPTNGATGQIVTFDVLNNGGGCVLTWNAVYNLAGAWTDPANAKHRVITFYCTDGTNFREISRTAADST